MTMTTRKRHSPEQVVRKLAQADRMLGEGEDVADVCRELAISEQTYYRWRNQFGGQKVPGPGPGRDQRLEEGVQPPPAALGAGLPSPRGLRCRLHPPNLTLTQRGSVHGSGQSTSCVAWSRRRCSGRGSR
jgi:Transposase